MLNARATAATLLLACCVAAAVYAQQTWYAAYDDALEAIKRQEWAKAEPLLKAALQRNPRQGRRVLFYGTRREDYLPEYYLAVVYANQQRTDEALDLLTKVERMGLVTPGTREYPEFQRLVTASRAIVEKRLAKTDERRDSPPADGKPVVTGPPAGGDPSGGRRGEDPAAALARATAERRERFNGLLTQATDEMTAGRFESAKSRTAEARTLGIDMARVDDVERRIDIAVLEGRTQTALAGGDVKEAQRLVGELRTLDARNGRLAGFETAITKAITDGATAVMRTALRAFFSGEYQTTIRLLEPMDAGPQSPRALLYLACSHAALALLEGPKGTARLQRGRELYARVRQATAKFAVDRRLLSPQILRALEMP